ncbi:helix-turn-helix domain-containing protein [Streptomyces sp. NPDC001414]
MPPSPEPRPERLDLPLVQKGKKLPGTAREKFTKRVVAAYRTGHRVTIREVCEVTGRSHGASRSVLREARATRRGPRTGGVAEQVKS